MHHRDFLFYDDRCVRSHHGEFLFYGYDAYGRVMKSSYSRAIGHELLQEM